MLKYTLFFAGALGLALLLNYMQQDYNKAMEICQEKHSFDTCFYSLNH